MAVNVPIRSVTPANMRGQPTGETVTDFPQPSFTDWGKQNLLTPDSGRLESGSPLIELVGKIDKLDLEWHGISRVNAAKVLQAFDHKYVLVEYLDARLGDWRTGHFYPGDMYARNWIAHKDCWEKVQFSLIKATPDK